MLHRPDAGATSACLSAGRVVLAFTAAALARAQPPRLRSEVSGRFIDFLLGAV